MDEAEFDKFADEYRAVLAAGIAVSGEEPEYFAEYKIMDVAREYEQYFGPASTVPRILDFGAGSGGSVPYVRKHFPNAQLTCLDVSRRCLEIAEKRYPSYAQYVHFDGSQIPFPAGYFDIAYAACVFHHIDHAEHTSLLKELCRVIGPRGCLFVFEHNPLNPVTMRIVNSCPFDENARVIRASAMKRQLSAAGFGHAAIRYRIFFPHALRILRPLERALQWLPMGGQYYAFAHK